MHFILFLFLILIDLTSKTQSKDKLEFKRIGKESFNSSTVHLVRKRSIFGQQITNQDKLLLTAYTVMNEKIMVHCKLKRPWSQGITAVRWIQISILPTKKTQRIHIIKKYRSGKFVLNNLYKHQGIRVKTSFSDPELAEMKMILNGSAPSRLGNRFYCLVGLVFPGLEYRVTPIEAEMVIKGTVPGKWKIKGEGKHEKRGKNKAKHESKKKKDSKRITILAITISGLTVILLIQIYCIYSLRGRIKKLKIEKICLSQMNLAEYDADSKRSRHSDLYVRRSDLGPPLFPEDIYPKSKLSLQQYDSNQTVRRTRSGSKSRQSSQIGRQRSSFPQEMGQHYSGSKLKQKMSRTRSTHHSQSIPSENSEELDYDAPHPKTSRTQSLHRSESEKPFAKEPPEFESPTSQFQSRMSLQRHTNDSPQRQSSKSSYRPASIHQQIDASRHSSQTSKYRDDAITSSHQQLPYNSHSPSKTPSYSPQFSPDAIDADFNQPSPSCQQQQQSMTHWPPSPSRAQSQEMPSVHSFLPQEASTPGPHVNPALAKQIHQLQIPSSTQAASLRGASVQHLDPVLASQISYLQDGSLQDASVSGLHLDPAIANQIHQLQTMSSSQVGHITSQIKTAPSQSPTMVRSNQSRGSEMAVQPMVPPSISHLQSFTSRQSVDLPVPPHQRTMASYQSMYASSPEIEALPPPPAPPILPDQVQSQAAANIYNSTRSDDLLGVMNRRRQSISPESKMSVYGQSNAALAESLPPQSMPMIVEHEIPGRADTDRNALLNSINARRSSTQFSTRFGPPMPPGEMFGNVEPDRNALLSSIADRRGSSTQQFTGVPPPVGDIDPGRNALLDSINAGRRSLTQQFSSVQGTAAHVEGMDGRNALLNSINARRSSEQQFSAPQELPEPVGEMDGRNAVFNSINARRESSTQQFSASQELPDPVEDMDPGRNALLDSINAGRRSSTQQFSSVQGTAAHVEGMDGRNALLNSINARRSSEQQFSAPQELPEPVGEMDGRNALFNSINARRESSTQQFSASQELPDPVEDMDPGRNALLNSINARRRSSTQQFSSVQGPPAPVEDMDGRNALLYSINARRGSSLPDLDISVPSNQFMPPPPPASDPEPGRGALLSSIAARRRSSTSSSIMPN